MEIKLLEGTENLAFRMKPVHVQKILGEPGEVEKLMDEEDFEIPTIIWHYPAHELSVFFEREPSELASLESNNKDILLAGNKVFAMSMSEIKVLMKEQGYTMVDEADEPWGEYRLSFNDALIDFYYEDNRMASVNWGVLPG